MGILGAVVLHLSPSLPLPPPFWPPLVGGGCGRQPARFPFFLHPPATHKGGPHVVRRGLGWLVATVRDGTALSDERTSDLVVSVRTGELSLRGTGT